MTGDGANDLGMIEAAGLGVAYHAKPAVAAAAAARIDHGDLTALLYAQGYRREEFVAGIEALTSSPADAPDFITTDRRLFEGRVSISCFNMPSRRRVGPCVRGDDAIVGAAATVTRPITARSAPRSAIRRRRWTTSSRTDFLPSFFN